MSRFRFRLETLRRLREIHRDEQRGRLAEAFQAEQILAQRRAANRDDLASTQQRQRELSRGATDVGQLLAAQRYVALLQAQERTLAEQAAQLAAEVERRRELVVEADRQVRVLDRLEERQRDEHQRQQSLAEGKFMDELATVRWRRPAL